MKNYLLLALLCGVSQQHDSLRAMLRKNTTRTVQFSTWPMCARFFAIQAKGRQPENQAKSDKAGNQFCANQTHNRVKALVNKGIDYRKVVMAQELEAGKEEKLVAHYKCEQNYHARAHEDFTAQARKMEEVKKQVHEVRKVAEQNGADDLATWCAGKSKLLENQLESVNKARSKIKEVLKEQQ